MTYDQFAADRAEYGYVPARLISATTLSNVLITWSLNSSKYGLHTTLKLQGDFPSSSSWRDSNRDQYSSYGLDMYKRDLLQSERAEDQLLGLLSSTFWGFASGKDSILRFGRALARANWHIVGNARHAPQHVDDILQQLQLTRNAVNLRKYEAALSEAMKIKFLGMSFASKLVMFMDPERVGVYDNVISGKLKNHPDPQLQSLYVNVKYGHAAAKLAQACTFARWCQYCQGVAGELNAAGSQWTDWDGKQYPWRAVDVERAFFSAPANQGMPL